MNVFSLSRTLVWNSIPRFLCQKSDQLLAKKKKKLLYERRIKKNIRLLLRPLSRLCMDFFFFNVLR